MSRKRTFTVHVNIDDMTAMLAGLDGPSEKSDWLDGYMVGVHGHPSRETWSQPKRMGYDFGAKHFAEVEEFRAEQKRKSDLAEAAKNAQKYPEGTHGLPTGTGSGDPAGDPIQQSNNPLIQQSKEPTTKKPRFVPPTEAEATEYASQIGFTEVKKWMGYYEANGWKAGKTKMVDWRGAMRYWLPKDGAAGAAPTPPSIQEWMQEGQAVATSNTTRNGATWPRDLCSAAYYQCSSSSWRGITDWRGKLRAECLRWVGNENGRAR